MLGRPRVPLRLTSCLALLAAIVPSASAQTGLWRAGLWRASASVGRTNGGETPAIALGAEIRALGPVAAGGRVALFLPDESTAEGEHTQGGAFESFLAIGRQIGPVVLRAAAGPGVSTITTSRYEDRAEVSRETFSRLFGVGTLGVDLFPIPDLGIGVEARGVRSRGEPDLSEVNVGLRLRF